MEKIQLGIKKYCDGDDNEIILIGNSAEILPHHDMMLPHWKKLAIGFNGRTLKKISLCGITLPTPVLDIIFPALQSIGLSILLHDVQLGNEGLLRLTSFIKDNTTIKTLSIGGERIYDLSIANSLSGAVKDHPSLNVLFFFKCGLNNAEILRRLLEGCTKLNHLGIDGEKLGCEAVRILGEFICNNYPLKHLNLTSSKISDNDTLLLASALQMNTNLSSLNLKKNDIAEEGEKALLKAMYDPTSMDTIIESNHSCVAFTYEMGSESSIAQRPPLETEVFLINVRDTHSIMQKIRMKVVAALCGVDGDLFDLSHFNDLPLELMPRVLELIQEHTKLRKKVVRSRELERDALSRLFHTLRGWELPLLFENLGSSSTK